MSTSDHNGNHDSPGRPFSATRRFGGEGSAHAKSNPFHALSPLGPTGAGSPGASGASTAFGLVWYRPPTFKYSDYEKSIVPLATVSSVESFWTVYVHLKRPSFLPAVSDYHIFRKGIRPVWEDKGNCKGGKWILRLKKGVADRYWDDLLLAMVGDQFAEAGEEVCGAVLSVRSGEDVLSVWTRIDGGRNIKIRETIKRLLALPADTNIVWRSHDDSIAQRSALDQARQDKTNPGSAPYTLDKRSSRGKDDQVPDASKPS
ncbi:MAG: hypothetical protein M1826_005195 [Phylliscum demangeonii]|nr:MAG: hypothetical protein M1826_005195 [Phylliscum demangeonii]